MRLVDSDALQAKCEKNHLNFVPIEFLKFAHTVDAVPVVRCKDCKWCDERITDDGMNIYHWCLMRDGEVPQMDWFCADGERRER